MNVWIGLSTFQERGELQVMGALLMRSYVLVGIRVSRTGEDTVSAEDPREDEVIHCPANAPIGRALLGHIAGETVVVALPNGETVTIKILNVDNSTQQSSG